MNGFADGNMYYVLSRQVLTQFMNGRTTYVTTIDPNHGISKRTMYDLVLDGFEIFMQRVEYDIGEFDVKMGVGFNVNDEDVVKELMKRALSTGRPGDTVTIFPNIDIPREIYEDIDPSIATVTLDTSPNGLPIYIYSLTRR